MESKTKHKQDVTEGVREREAETGVQWFLGLCEYTDVVGDELQKKEGKSERRGKKQMFKMGYGVRVGGNGRRRLMYVDERRRRRKRERQTTIYVIRSFHK